MQKRTKKKVDHILKGQKLFTFIYSKPKKNIFNNNWKQTVRIKIKTQKHTQMKRKLKWFHWINNSNKKKQIGSENV